MYEIRILAVLGLVLQRELRGSVGERERHCIGLRHGRVSRHDRIEDTLVDRPQSVHVHAHHSFGGTLSTHKLYQRLHSKTTAAET